MSVTVSDILAASGRINGLVHKTPVIRNGYLDEISRRCLHMKGEHAQKTGSFKARGALNAVLKLEMRAEKVDAVCCDSSGNHGAGLAWAAQTQGKTCYIAVPHGAPKSKVDAIETYGGKVHFCKSDDQSRNEKADYLIDHFGAKLIHANQDLDVIAGQGTIGLEFLEQVPALDAIIVPVGGGGMITGISILAKTINPNIKIIAAEPKNVDDCAQSVAAGKFLVTEKSFTICDGVRTNIGETTWPYIQKYVDRVIAVGEGEIARAWKLLMERAKITIEPTGGLALAVALSEEFKNVFPEDEFKNVGLIVCGGNLDLSVVPKMLELAQQP